MDTKTNMRRTGIWRAALAGALCLLVCAGCAQVGTDGSSSAVPTGKVTAYGVIDEGISVTR
jgi:hypothetical protein